MNGNQNGSVRFEMGLAFIMMVLLLGLAGCQSIDQNQDSSAHRADADSDSAPTTRPATDDRVITLAADAWPPYNCVADDTNAGYMVDIARAIFGPAGYRVDYVIVPWKRALEGTNSGKYDGAVAVTKAEYEELVFPRHELLRSALSFFVRSDFAWEFTGPADLDEVSLGVARGYGYTSWLNEHIEKHVDDPGRIQIMEGNFPLRQNIRKLLAGRIDAMVGDVNCVRYTAMRDGLQDELRFAGSDPEEAWCYIGFTPAGDRGRDLAAQFDRGLEHLRASGQLQSILARYGVEDWVSTERQP